MTIDELCKQLDVVTKAASDGDNHDRWCELIVSVRLALSNGHREQLQQLVNSGPVHDGDVISKALRGDLLRWGLAARVMVKGEWGYTAATYRGGHVLNDAIEVTS